MTSTEIKQLRATLNLTQEAMAHLIGVTVFTINRWERGITKPSPLAERRLLEITRNQMKEGKT